MMRLLLPLAAAHCTAMAVDKGATKDGTTFISTTSDGSPGDFRLVHVPAKDHAPGAKRAVFLQKQDYPRFSTHGRAPAYEPDGTDPVIAPIGYIPEVAHTYAYVDAAYAVMNEKGLAIGETSCSAKLTAAPIGSPNGTALFWVGELSDIALERCATARCAIELIGGLAETYGFYGTLDVMEGGETLTIGDKDEAWIFHILPDDTGKSAVWAAQKVPSGEATVVPNTFVLRELDLNSHDTLYSSTMVPVAKRLGWYTDGPFDFAKTYSAGEYTHPHYAGRRVWRALSTWAPSLNLDPFVGVLSAKPTYPVSVKPDTPLELKDMFHLYRDHLEGTRFDMTLPNLAGGPYQSPDRAEPGAVEDTFKYGAWERAISLPRTSYGFIAVPLSGVVHFAPCAPHASVFLPVAVAALTSDIPELGTGSQRAFANNNAWWAAAALQEYLDNKYSLAIDRMRAVQATLEAKGAALQLDGADAEAVNKAFVTQAVQQMWQLWQQMLAEFQLGYQNYGKDKVGYPKWVLEQSGFSKWAMSYPEEPDLPQRFDALRKEQADAQVGADAIRAKHRPDTGVVV